MYISSMTGFARVMGTLSIEQTDYSWFWEIKSVNGKSLEVKAKRPLWLDGANQAAKALVAKYLSRGNVIANLEIGASGQVPELKINEPLLQRITEQAIKLYLAHPQELQKPVASELLNVRGVIEVDEVSKGEDVIEKLQVALLESLGQACEALQQDRRNEGQKIDAVLREIMERIKAEVQKVGVIASVAPERLKEKLQQQISQLLEAGSQISEERLAQELVLYVTKADIREEIDRLNAHIKTAGELLDNGGAAGRRLDFLCQELNRETNTICSKSGDVELTNRGMELKALIEQFREQVQNIE